MKTTKTTHLLAAFLADVFKGWTAPEAIYALALIGLQIVTYIWNPDSLAGFIAGLTGTICVILAAKRKISNYVFGFIQTAVGLYLGLQVRLWGESAENLFYLISQFVGFAAWRNHLVTEEGENHQQVEQVETRKFTLGHWLLSLGAIAISTILFGWLFERLNGTQPYVDALTLVTAFIAQIIMLARYREQWVFWFVLNVVSLFQWFTLGNMSMVALYIAFLINNAYGYWQWTKGAKD